MVPHPEPLPQITIKLLLLVPALGFSLHSIPTYQVLSLNFYSTRLLPLVQPRPSRSVPALSRFFHLALPLQVPPLRSDLPNHVFPLRPRPTQAPPLMPCLDSCQTAVKQSLVWDAGQLVSYLCCGGAWFSSSLTHSLSLCLRPQEQQPHLPAALLYARGGRGEPIHLFFTPRQWHAEVFAHPHPS